MTTITTTTAPPPPAERTGRAALDQVIAAALAIGARWPALHVSVSASCAGGVARTTDVSLQVLATAPRDASDAERSDVERQAAEALAALTDRRGSHRSDDGSAAFVYGSLAGARVYVVAPAAIAARVLGPEVRA